MSLPTMDVKKHTKGCDRFVIPDLDSTETFLQGNFVPVQISGFAFWSKQSELGSVSENVTIKGRF